MTDRRAVRNTFQEGVTQEERDDRISAELGVPQHGFRGVPHQSEEEMDLMSSLRGVPMTGPDPVWGDPVEEVYEAPRCTGKTLLGFDCKAYAVMESDYCVAHLRKQHGS